jgi:cell division septum initiation protein DivIVA
MSDVEKEARLAWWNPRDREELEALEILINEYVTAIRCESRILEEVEELRKRINEYGKFDEHGYIYATALRLARKAHKYAEQLKARYRETGEIAVEAARAVLHRKTEQHGAAPAPIKTVAPNKDTRSGGATATDKVLGRPQYADGYKIDEAGEVIGLDDRRAEDAARRRDADKLAEDMRAKRKAREEKAALKAKILKQMHLRLNHLVKFVRNCTFAECAQFGKLSKLGKPDEVVCKVLTDEQIREALQGDPCLTSS